MAATNITGLPSTGYVNTAIATITKGVLQRIGTDPILSRFIKNDVSFDRDLVSSFNFRDSVNITIAPKLTGQLSSNIGDSKVFQTATFGNVVLSLDKVALTSFDYRTINESIKSGQTSLRDTLIDSASITLIDTMYADVVRLMANNANIASDQRIGTVGATFNYAALRRLRTTAQKQFRVSRSQRIILLLNPDAYESLTADANFQYQISADDSTIKSGIISTTLNIEIYADPMLGATGGNSQSISGTAGAVGLAFLPDSAVLASRQIAISDPTRQYRASVDGVSALVGSTFSNALVGGMSEQTSMEVMYGFQTLPIPRFDTANSNATTWLMLGGV
jgi:hypothetical protein